MAKNISTGLISVLACVGLSPAHAAPASYKLTGTVGNTCNFPTTSLSPAVRSNGASVLSVTNASALTAKVSCNYATTVSLQLKSTALYTATAASAGETRIINYAATASTWGSNPFVQTNDSISGGGTTQYTGAAVSVVGPVSRTLTVAAGGFSYPGGATKAVKNADYSSTVTLVFSATP